jgi:hypothetical protein
MLSHNYSLWLEPAPGALRDRLQKEIATQASAHAGPRFAAHVTLLPDVQMERPQLLETAQELAKKLKVLQGMS